MRSILIVPPDGDDLASALGSAASAVVADPAPGAASTHDRCAPVSRWLTQVRRAARGGALYVAVHDLSSGFIDRDLDAAAAAGPDGILLRSCRSAEDVQRLGAKLAVREAENGFGDGRIRILAVVASSAAGVMALAGFGGAGRRLAGLVWDDRPLAQELGLAAEDPALPWPAPLAQARAMTILAAGAAGVPAFDSALRAPDHLFEARCVAGRRDGFVGALARTTGQVRVIEAVYGRGGGSVRTR